MKPVSRATRSYSWRAAALSWRVCQYTLLLAGLAVNVFGPRLLALWRKPQPA